MAADSLARREGTTLAPMQLFKFFFLLVVIAVLGCKSDKEEAPQERDVESWEKALVNEEKTTPRAKALQKGKHGTATEKSRTGEQAARIKRADMQGGSSETKEEVRGAQVGSKAPRFTLEDLDGNEVRLEQFVGQVVVLEWFNPKCPFVRAAHTKGSLQGAAERAERKGVVWLAINSGAPGKQGHGISVNRRGKQRFGMKYPVLVDSSGDVGHAYGAKRTPHMFIIDERGVLVYDGAVDNSPDGEGKSPEGGRLISYVDRALAELDAGKSVSIPETKPYGCSVKYAD